MVEQVTTSTSMKQLQAFITLYRHSEAGLSCDVTTSPTLSICDLGKVYVWLVGVDPRVAPQIAAKVAHAHNVHVMIRGGDDPVLCASDGVEYGSNLKHGAPAQSPPPPP